MKKKFFFIFCFFLIISCNKNDGPLEKYEDDFETFYTKFHADDEYQISHIQFPLAGRPSATQQGDHSDFKWQQQEWRIQRLFDPEETGLKSSFKKISDEFIIEIITLDDGSFGIERRFSKFGEDGWYLIYFADLHPLSSNNDPLRF